MIETVVKSNDLDKLLQDFIKIQATTRALPLKAMTSIVHVVLDSAREKAPVRSGALKQSLDSEATETSDGAAGYITSDKPQFNFVIVGTKRHFVAPTNVSALKFEVGGKTYFSKGHFVSGIKPNDFVEAGILAKSDEVAAIINKEAEEAVSGRK